MMNISDSLKTFLNPHRRKVLGRNRNVNNGNGNVNGNRNNVANNIDDDGRCG